MNFSLIKWEFPGVSFMELPGAGPFHQWIYWLVLWPTSTELLLRVPDNREILFIGDHKHMNYYYNITVTVLQPGNSQEAENEETIWRNLGSLTLMCKHSWRDEQEFSRN